MTVRLFFAAPLIPLPQSIEPAEGAYALTPATTICSNDERAAATLDFLSTWLAKVDRPVPKRGERDCDVSFELVRTFAPEPPERYTLTVSNDGVVVRSSSESGLFYGAVTLLQIARHDATLPAVEIVDAPRFAWRGYLLDVARHHRPPEFVKRTIDWMALHKLNTLHWHLTDDQGWRIPIDAHPKLVEVGACRKTAGAEPRRYCGHYTKDEIRDIVAYAAARHVTIVPEIDVPGHAQAAIAAYPELGVDDDEPAVSNRWGVHTYLFDVEESTFAFLEDVFDEVLALFPSRHIHVGGDEAAKDRWEKSERVQARMRELGIANEAKLQGYFTARLGKYLAERGRVLVGWDEILEGGVPADAVVMSWRGEKGGIEAAKAGHDVVMSPHPTMYLDFLQERGRNPPPGRPNAVTLRDYYAYEPVPAALDDAQAKRVLGAQANGWAEHLRTEARVEHASWPRMTALAERLWSSKDVRDFGDFARRATPWLATLRTLGLRAAPLDPKPEPLRERTRSSAELSVCKEGLVLRLEDDAPAEGERAVYTVDLFEPCWRWDGAPRAASIEVVVGQVPYNFELWKDASKIVATGKVGEHGALVVSDCGTRTYATIDLAPAASRHATTTVGAALDDFAGGALCFRYATGSHDPLWTIDSVTLPR